MLKKIKNYIKEVWNAPSWVKGKDDLYYKPTCGAINPNEFLKNENK